MAGCSIGSLADHKKALIPLNTPCLFQLGEPLIIKPKEREKLLAAVGPTTIEAWIKQFPSWADEWEAGFSENGAYVLYRSNMLLWQPYEVVRLDLTAWLKEQTDEKIKLIGEESHKWKGEDELNRFFYWLERPHLATKEPKKMPVPYEQRVTPEYLAEQEAKRINSMFDSLKNLVGNDRLMVELVDEGFAVTSVRPHKCMSEYHDYAEVFGESFLALRVDNGFKISFPVRKEYLTAEWLPKWKALVGMPLYEERPPLEEEDED